MHEFLPVPVVEPHDILDAINASFERSAKSLDWYRWKHLEGPWGPSTGWAVRDGSSIIGVRLFVPWLVMTNGDPRPALRAMDGAVRPEGRRMGLFSKLVRLGLDDVVAGTVAADVVYSTSVPASRDAYKKLGWSVFDVDHLVTPTRWSTAKTELHRWPDLPALQLPPPTTESGVQTLWTHDSVRWRLDPRSGHEYRTYSLVNASDSNGIVVRRTALRGMPALAVGLAWGNEREQAELLRSVARRERCPVAIMCASSGGVSRRRGLRRGASTVSWWAPSDATTSNLEAPANWRFSMLDLEGVM